MRKLVFTESDNLNFKHLYFGFVQGGNNLNKESKARNIVRLESRIHKKFDEISEDDPNDKSLAIKLKTGIQTVMFTTEEYQHIDKCIDAVGWPTLAAKQVALMLDFWDEAQKVEG